MHPAPDKQDPSLCPVVSVPLISCTLHPAPPKHAPSLCPVSVTLTCCSCSCVFNRPWPAVSKGWCEGCSLCLDPGRPLLQCCKRWQNFGPLRWYASVPPHPTHTHACTCSPFFSLLYSLRHVSPASRMITALPHPLHF